MILLKTLEFTPREIDGWSSGVRKFGDTLTEVHGPNTRGKTPLLKGIVYCLGYPVELPEEVRRHCKSVKIVLEKDFATHIFERDLRQPYFITHIDPDGVEVTFANEDDMSSRFFGILGVERPELTAKFGQSAVMPYISNIFPAFWIDQDLGWSDIYRVLPSKSFIKSQKQEVIRLMLGLSPKYPFRDKSNFQNAKDDLQVVLEEIEIKKRLMRELDIRNSEINANELTELETTRATLVNKIEGLISKVIYSESISESVSEEIRNIDRRIIETATRVEQLRSRHGKLLSEANDLEAEISILSDNSNIAEMFKEFCGNDKCSVFKKEGFGKKLLYLKDQKKDMLMVTSELSEEIRNLEGKQEGLQKSLENIRHSRPVVGKQVADDSSFQLSRKYSEEVAEIDVKVAIYKQSQNIRLQFGALLAKKDRAEVKVKELSPRGGKVAKANAILEALNFLQTKMSEWLDVVGVKFAEVSFDDKFDLFIDKKRFGEGSEESGSERQRVVLAYHAAFLETSLILGGSHPGILIFDGVRQHELNLGDLKAYLTKLISLQVEYKTSVQIIYSITADDFDVGDVSEKETWMPNKVIDEKMWFIGPDSSDEGIVPAEDE